MRIVYKHIVMVLIILFNIALNVEAQDYCVEIAENKTCIESGGTKIFEGKSITKDCWKYQVEYVCNRENEYVDYCVGLKNILGCGLMSSNCVKYTIHGTCEEYDVYYNCNANRQNNNLFTIDFEHTITQTGELTACTSTVEKQNKCYPVGNRCLNDSCTSTRLDYSCIDSIALEDCDKIDLTDCTLDKREFIDRENKSEKYTYKCKREGLQNLNCNPKIECLDGSCYEAEETQNNTEDMMETLSLLATLNESVKTINTDDLTMLNGENLKCKKSTGAVGSFEDCCGDANWGNSLGASCSQDELKLKEKSANGDCIYIGDYCSEEWDLGLGKVCVAKKYSYCCFSNKFSKIIGRATRQQGLQNWGNAEYTNCAGIPIDRLQELDFSIIDFSELYDDIKSSVQQDDINNRIQQSIGRLQNSGL